MSNRSDETVLPLRDRIARVIGNAIRDSNEHHGFIALGLCADAVLALVAEQSERPASYEDALKEYDRAKARGCDNRQAVRFMLDAINRVTHEEAHRRLSEQAKREVTDEMCEAFEVAAGKWAHGFRSSVRKGLAAALNG